MIGAEGGEGVSVLCTPGITYMLIYYYGGIRHKANHKFGQAKAVCI